MTEFHRRDFVAALAVAGAAAASPGRAQTPATPSAQAPRFGFDEVVRRAQELAAAPLAPPPLLPEQIARLDPDLARQIAFRHDRLLLAGGGSRFRLQAIHLRPGGDHPVTINLIRDGIATPIPYSANLFDYGRAKFDRPLPLNLGFAGFRLKFPLNTPDVFDDALVFTSANSFRFLGRGQSPGALLRALSMNAGRDTMEKPYYREFWIERPDRDASRAVVYGLLDGESTTGAIKLELSPGADSMLVVTQTLFPRRVGGVLGLASMTTNFLKGDGERQVHDSDGLEMRTGAGEWLWRPLRNPAKPGQYSFFDSNPRGFGLVQRDRDFGHYQDVAQGYERRPGFWVEPLGDWGEGRIELNEAPASDAGTKNVEVAWVPKTERTPGKPVTLSYRVAARLAPRKSVATGRAVGTFYDTAAAPASARATIDFSGGDLAYYAKDPGVVEIVATANNGRILKTGLLANPNVDGLRAVVDFAVDPGQTADLRVALRAGAKSISETWTTPWEG